MPLHAARLNDVLAFRAPYVETKLMRLGIAETELQAFALFQEAKKYLLLASLHTERVIPMFSLRVDEAWHQFILFTAEYAAYCQEFAGRYLHHSPAADAALVMTPSAAGAAAAESSDRMSFSEFRAAYEGVFGPLADSWFDAPFVSASTRLTRCDWTIPLAVRSEAARALLIAESDPPAVLCRVNLRARAALEFVVRQSLFLVRELPELSDDLERVALCRPLVQFNVLRIAP